MKEQNTKFDDVIDFGGWENEEDKLRYNLTWTHEQILDWLEEVNEWQRIVKEQSYVLRKNR